MSRHLLKYHVGIPLGVVVGLVLFGVPVARALSYGIVVGCVTMMAMMMGGHDHGAHQPHGDDRGAEGLNRRRR